MCRNPLRRKVFRRTRPWPRQAGSIPVCRKRECLVGSLNRVRLVGNLNRLRLVGSRNQLRRNSFRPRSFRRNSFRLSR